MNEVTLIEMGQYLKEFKNSGYSGRYKFLVGSYYVGLFL